MSSMRVVSLFLSVAYYLIIYRIFTINNIRQYMRLSTPVLVFPRLNLKLFDENSYVG